MSELSEPKLIKNTEYEEVKGQILEEFALIPEQQKKLDNLVWNIDTVIKNTLGINSVNKVDDWFKEQARLESIHDYASLTL